MLAFVFVFTAAAGAYAEGAKAQESDQQINDFSLAGYGERGRKTWDLSGKSADITGDIVRLQKIEGNLFGEKDIIKLVADKGDFNKADGKVHLEKNVVVTTASGARLTTDSLDWDRKKQLVTTQDRVNIEKENIVTTATGAKGEPGLNLVTLEKDVTVKIHPQIKEDAARPSLQEPITVTCDGPVEVDYQKNAATFRNNVSAKRADLTINCDTMDIYFLRRETASEAEKANAFMGSRIDRIVAHGNVKITRGENISYSEEAVYSAASQKITLNGRPKLIIYSAGDFKEAIVDNATSEGARRDAPPGN
jgi:LPS export ABC transporter protein LptC